MKYKTCAGKTGRRHKPLFPILLLSWMGIGFLTSGCKNDAPPMTHAIQQRDSLPVMVSYGVSKLISDSGVIRYKIIAEEWKVYDKTNPPKQTFLKGIFMEKFDPKFKVELHITADTAYWYNQNLWELRGRVYIHKKNGTTVRTDELFWDMEKRLLYSHRYIRITTSQEDLDGVGFRSNEDLTEYEFINSSGSFPMPEETAETDTVNTDTIN